MRKLEASEAVSNLLIFTSVSLAFTPLLLGDSLFLIVTGFLDESLVMLDQVAAYLTWLIG
ncbi:MAG TPA: hypothetical protein VJ023_21920 [Pyrinomonadaceae bacterium]|nr:hypothetical protein [Pyrinomonadaceae bacterium]